MMIELIRRAVLVLKSERGIETLEWILIGALIAAVAVVVYPGTLKDQLVTAVTSLGQAISTQASAA